MNFRSPRIYYPVLLTTLAAAFLAFWEPGWVRSLELYVLIALVALLGIPHGATDFVIYRYLSNRELNRGQTVRFFVYYLLLVAAYALVWYLTPLLALGIFLGLSCYHFGQSNLHYVDFSERAYLKPVAYTFWGTFVLFIPILLRYPEAREIIENIIGKRDAFFAVTYELRYFLIAGIGVMNLVILGYLRFRKCLDFQSFAKEVGSLLILGVLFGVAPLLFAFVIYFALWHSLSSILEQIKALRSADSHFGLAHFYLKALPLTLISLMGIAGLLFLSLQLNWGTSAVGLFFVIISTITLPHMLIIDRLHETA